MRRTQFVALGGFLLVVTCSAGLGIASNAGRSAPPPPVPCYREDGSKPRLEADGPGGERLRNEEGDRLIRVTCPMPGSSRSTPSFESFICVTTTDWLGRETEECVVEECGYELNERGKAVDVCEEATRSPGEH